MGRTGVVNVNSWPADIMVRKFVRVIFVVVGGYGGLSITQTRLRSTSQRIPVVIRGNIGPNELDEIIAVSTDTDRRITAVQHNIAGIVFPWISRPRCLWTVSLPNHVPPTVHTLHCN